MKYRIPSRLTRLNLINFVALIMQIKEVSYGSEYLLYYDQFATYLIMKVNCHDCNVVHA